MTIDDKTIEKILKDINFPIYIKEYCSKKISLSNYNFYLKDILILSKEYCIDCLKDKHYGVAFLHCLTDKGYEEVNTVRFKQEEK